MNTRDASTVDEVLFELREQFEVAGIDNPAADAQLILAHVLGTSRGGVQSLAVLKTQISIEDREAAQHLASQRADRVPLQHLTGRAPFRGIELGVGPGVFVPRPETEVTAQIALDSLLAVPDPEPLVVDLCTGSGAIALALAREMPTARVWAIEKSREAHAWAARNVAELGEGRVELLLGDAGDAAQLLPASLLGRVQVLVSNPPYVPEGMVPRDPEVRDHDPDLALYSGEDGLDLIRILSRVGREVVAPGGVIVLEHAEQQGAVIRGILEADGWRSAATHRDLTLRDRVTTAIR